MTEGPVRRPRHLLDPEDLRRSHQRSQGTQESLGNVAQHANSRSLAVRLVAGPPVELCIADDGAGFDPDGVPGGHLGLRIMSERAQAVGAVFSVNSAPGQGTSIRVRFDP